MWAFLIGSSYNLTAMSIERHGAITRPLKHDEHKVRRRFPLILVLVYIPVILHMLPTYLSSRYVDGACRVNYDLPEGFRSSQIYIAMFMDLIIPGSIMLFCYIHMAMFLKKTMKSFSGGTEKGSSTGEVILIITIYSLSITDEN